MYMFTRETMYFINLRNAYLRTPWHASRISSKTVLFTSVASEYLSEEGLRAQFGDTMVNYWAVTDCKELEKMVDDRDKAAMKLEGGEIKLSQTANKNRLKAEKKAASGKGASSTSDVEPGTTSSQWLNKKDRPTHRTKFLIGKKVDTIDYSREQLRELTPKIEKMQTTHRDGGAKTVQAVFVEFVNQEEAHAAFRAMNFKKDRMDVRAIGAAPDEIVWKNLSISRSQQFLRRIATTTFITLMIIYWAIPVAVVGAISNINYLTQRVKFLSFINDIPPVILGVVTGLLPSVALSILMSLVPIVCRLVAKLRGEVTLARVELKTQGKHSPDSGHSIFANTFFQHGTFHSR